MKKHGARYYDIVALIVFSLCIVPILAFYILKDGGLHINNSLSLYMGRELWSATIFAICNIVISYNIWQYVERLKTRFGKVWRVLGLVVIASFIGLSFCPYMLFGDGIITFMHQVFSRMMFISMAAMIFIQGVADTGLRRAVLYIFVIYGMVLAFLSFTTQIFWDDTFIFEMAYLYGFMLMLFISAHRQSHQKDPQ